MKLLYRFDEVRIKACPRSKHKVGGRERVMVYVRTSNIYNRTVLKGDLWEAVSIQAQVQLTGLAALASWSNFSFIPN